MNWFRRLFNRNNMIFTTNNLVRAREDLNSAVDEFASSTTTSTSGVGLAQSDDHVVDSFRYSVAMGTQPEPNYNHLMIQAARAIINHRNTIEEIRDGRSILWYGCRNNSRPSYTFITRGESNIRQFEISDEFIRRYEAHPSGSPAVEELQGDIAPAQSLAQLAGSAWTTQYSNDEVHQQLDKKCKKQSLKDLNNNSLKQVEETTNILKTYEESHRSHKEK